MTAELAKKTDIELTEHLALVFALERHVQEMPDQIDLEEITDHDFCTGLYARTMRLPAFTVLTGAIHKEECFFVVRIGTLLVTTPDGPIQLNPGDMFKTYPGTKRAGFCLTDCVVTTFHANPEELRDEATIWDHYTVEPPKSLLDFLETMKLGVLS